MPGEGEKLEYGEKLSKALIEFSPKSLRTIKFSALDFKFSLKTLEYLLKHWKGRAALSIFTSDADYKKEEYLEIINKYMNDEVIKDFKCDDVFGDCYFFNKIQSRKNRLFFKFAGFFLSPCFLPL